MNDGTYVWNGTSTSESTITVQPATTVVPTPTITVPPITIGPAIPTIRVQPYYDFWIKLDNGKITINWDKFEGIELRVGDEVITITRKELEEVLVKILPGLLEKLVLAKLLR